MFKVERRELARGEWQSDVTSLWVFRCGRVWSLILMSWNLFERNWSSWWWLLEGDSCLERGTS